MNRFNTEENMQNIELSSVSDEIYTVYEKAYNKSTVPDSRILVFLTGFCIGMVFFYFSKGDGSCIIEYEQLVWLQNISMYQTGLFEYILNLRIKQLIFIWICALSSMASIFSYLIMGWYGFEVGVIIFSLVYQYGIKGIALTFSLFFPQVLFYIIVFFMIFGKSLEGYKKNYHKDDTIKYKGIKGKLEKLKKIIVIILIFLIGILCEAYINPEIIRKIALFF